MKLKDKITQLRALIDGKLEERKKHTDAIAAVRAACEPSEDGKRAQRDPFDDEAQKVREAEEARTKVDAEIAELQRQEKAYTEELERDEAADRLTEQYRSGAKRPAYDDVARVGSEERTYTAQKSARGEASFFIDAYGAQRGNMAARERIERNLKEAKAEGEISERALTTSSFGGLVVPQYLVDQVATVARAGRPFANTVQHQQLPERGMALVIPRGTTGAAAAVQAAQNTAVAEQDEVFGDLTVPVVTVAGQQKVSRQSLERGTPGIDALIYNDLVGAHAVAINVQTLMGSGASGQMLGVLNTAGINQMSAYTAAVTMATFYAKLAGAVNAVETTRFMAPTALALAPRRWNWAISQFDQQGRPLVVPRNNGPMNALGNWDEPKDTPSPTPVGELQGLPTITDASIPLAVGTGPEDPSIVYRREDLILWEEGDGLPKQLRFDEPLGNQLEVVMVAYSYAAFTAGRYPSAVAVIGGNAASAGQGQVTPTF